MKKLYFILCCILFFLPLFLPACAKEQMVEDEQFANESAAVQEDTGQEDTPANLQPEGEMEISFLAGLTEADLVSYFDTFDNAVFILSDGVTNIIYNEAFANERQYPYSTFKIPNALIALEAGVISIEDSSKEWNGDVYSRQEWMQNQDLASAMKYSCVWYYKQLAVAVGPTAMAAGLESIGYGNMDISGGIDTFWLGSSLKISPLEQLDFLKGLYDHTLPFSQEHMAYVKSILLQEGYSITLYGKTGSSGNGQGWFVGYAMLEGNPCFVVSYIEGEGVDGLFVRDIAAQIIQDLF